MPILIGGPKAWKTRAHGDIGVSFHWINDEPAMVLFPARRAVGMAGAYVVCLSAAFKYADPRTGAPTPYLIQQSIVAAKQLGFLETDTFACRKIAEIIVDGLPDLVDMPPEPVGMNQAQAESVGEMTIKLDGKTLHEGEISAPEVGAE